MRRSSGGRLPSVGARVFVAVDVGDAVRREAARVVSALQMKLEAAKTPPKVVWVKPAALHVTIRFLGEVEPAEVERITPLLAPPILLAPFDVQWRGIGTFPNNRHPRALWLGVIHGAAQLAAIEAEISKRLAGAAVDLDDRALLPHLTLGRVKMAGAGVDWPKVLQSAEVKNATSFIDRVTLYLSKLSQHGPHYTELVSAPLIDQAITRSPDR
jgi:2'-5' RNA ligase